MKLFKKIIRSQRGVALVTMMLLLSALTVLAVGAVMVSSIDLQLASNYYQNSRAFYAAESGIEKALSDIQSLLDGQGMVTNDDLATILEPELESFSFEEFTVIRSDSSFIDTIDTGPYMGMVSLNQPIDITSKVIGTGNSRYHIVVGVEGLQIPIFQFGVFYDDSLEIHNGPPMDFIGRVHTNSSLFLGTNDLSRFFRNITIAGNLYRFRIWNHETFTGTIQIEEPLGSLVDLTYDSEDYVGNDEGWVTQTNADFGGRLRTRAHNITPLGMPIPRTIEPIEIIKPRDGGDGAALKLERMDYKADTRVYAVSNLSTITTLDNSGGSKVLADPDAITPSPDAFYDDREGEWVDLLVLDVSRLTAGDLDGGVVYISIDEESGQHKGIKIINGSTLPAPMTVASNNSIYIQGNYNTVNWQPSAVVADAVYLLSNNWDDANNPDPGTDASVKNASSTTYYVAILAGDTPNNAGAYNGGLENFPRFLENWGGQTCRIVGSFINLFLSENATGQWAWGAPIYFAPDRDWWFEVNFLDFDKLPPGTPSVGSVLRIAFRQEFFE